MSFAYDVKAELCKVPINRSCCAVAEGCGVLLYASAFTANEVRIVTENDEFAARLPKLFQKAFSLRFDELPDKSKDGGKLVFRITQEDKLDTIWRALEIMSAKIEEEMRNTVNRRVNCDAANLDKAVLASREQVEAFTRLTESGAINDLPVILQEVAVARLLQPELTLSELAATFDPPLTKSCLNHRIRKLMEIAKKEENE